VLGNGASAADLKFQPFATRALRTVKSRSVTGFFYLFVPLKFFEVRVEECR
jgi:hypothetical protein